MVASAFVYGQQAAPQRPPASLAGTPGRDTNAAPPGAASITGSVAGANGKPVRRARVVASNATGGGSSSATSDDQGNFAITQLTAGAYTLTVSKAGYLDSVYGEKQPGSGHAGTPITIADGQHLERLSLPIARGGVLTGAVLDEFGDPAYGVSVRALRWNMRAGERSLTSQSTVQTDDRGIYRITALPPGDYIVSATPRTDNETMVADMKKMVEVAQTQLAASGGGSFQFMTSNNSPAAAADNAPATGYAPVYYPGVLTLTSATSVTLGISEEKPAIDLQLQMVPLGQITGTVMSTDGRPLGGAQVTLVDVAQIALGASRTTGLGPDGKFSFTNVVPGQYAVTARSGARTMTTYTADATGALTSVVMSAAQRGSGPGRAGGEPPPPPQWAEADVIVDGRSPSIVSLALQSGMNVSGALEFDGSGTVPADLTQIRIQLAPASQSDPMSSVAGAVATNLDADGRFTIPDVMPGRCRVSAQGARGWSLKSFDVSGRDALDFLVEVKPNTNISGGSGMLTTRSASIAGLLQDASGQPTAQYTIIAFSKDPAYWTPQSRRILSTRPSTDGRFSVSGLPAGDYQLVAVDDVAQGQWFDPAYLRTVVSAAITVTVGDGERKTQDLRVSK